MVKGVRREVVGSGMVRSVRDVVDLNEASPENVRAALDGLATSWRWDRSLRPLIAWLETQLPIVSACPGQADKRCCGRWQRPDNEGWPACRGGNWRELEDFEWYVRDVHQRIGFLRDQVERSDATGAAIFGIELGAAILQLRLKGGVEQLWERGVKAKRDTASGGGSNRKRTDRERWNLVEAEIANGKLGKTACYSKVADDLGESLSTIEKSCRRHRKTEAAKNLP